MAKLLSFDISSSNIGWSILEYDKLTNKITLNEYGVIKPDKKSNSIVERLYKTKKEILNLFNRLKPDHIAIEEIVQFMQNRSSAKTILTLTSFNRMVGLASMEYLNKCPTFISVMTVRSQIKFDKKISKEEVPDIVAKRLNIGFPWYMKKTGAVDPKSYDLADAIAVGLTYLYKFEKFPKN